MVNQDLKQFMKYEMKLLMRDWGYQIILLIGFILVIFLQLFSQGNIRKVEWIAISLPSAIPYANAYLINFLQVFIAIFWFGKFINNRKTCRSNEIISIHPFSNSTYFWGKSLAFIYLMLIYNIILVLVAIFINIFASDSPLFLYTYLFYFLTLTIPTLFFVTGLVICVKSIIRNNALSLMLLLGLICLDILYAPYFFHGALDLFSSTLSNVFSEVTGFYGIGFYLLHRGTFFLWGCGLLVLGSLSINRIPNKIKMKQPILAKGIIFIILGCISISLYLNGFSKEQYKRESIYALFLKYESALKARITNHYIQFKQHGYQLDAISKLHIYNPNSQNLSSIIFYLNPGLSVVETTIEGKSVNFKREGQILMVEHILQPQDSTFIEIHYTGSIVPEVFYPEVKNLNSYHTARCYSIFNLGKDYYYLNPDYTILTPECLWYPTCLPPVNISSPYSTLENYTRFYLTVIGEKNRISISQGRAQMNGDTTRFINHQDLTGISLCIGKYTRKAISHNKKLYEIYVFKGHEYLVEQFSDPVEIINYCNNLYQSGDEKYVFHKLALVETPIHFCAYSRPWKNKTEYVQPELIFRPEREALTRTSFKVQKEINNEGISPQLECWTYYLWNFEETRKLIQGNIFFGKLNLKDHKNEYDISSITRKNHYFIYSMEFPGIDMLFQESINSWESAINSYKNYVTLNLAIQYFNAHNLSDALQDSININQLKQIIWSKSNYYLKYLLCHISSEELYKFQQAFISQHLFQDISYEQYCKEIQEKYNIDLLAFTRQLYEEKQLASFRVRDAQIELVTNATGKKGYIESVKVWNKGNVDGIITLAAPNRTNTHYLIPAGTCKEIKNYFEGEPDEFNLEVQTNLADNIPACYSFEKIKPKETNLKYFHSGVFDTDTSLFLPLSNEYVVDNMSSNFHLIEDKHILNNPEQWKYIPYEGAYGEPVAGLHSKLAGNGSSKIEWEIMLPEDGIYELFIYIAEKAIKSAARSLKFIGTTKVEKKEPTQTYYFKHADGEEKMTLEVLHLGNGWVSLGKYHFTAGHTSLILTDEGADQYQKIFADAVKWVKYTK